MDRYINIPIKERPQTFILMEFKSDTNMLGQPIKFFASDFAHTLGISKDIAKDYLGKEYFATNWGYILPCWIADAAENSWSAIEIFQESKRKWI